MNEPLESIVKESTVEKPSLLDEMKVQVKHYPKNWVEYMKGLMPTLVVSTIGAFYGPDVAQELGYTSEFSKILGTYILGYSMGYTTAFGIEYFRHKEKYPNGIFSKEFKDYIVSFIAADYVADLSVFQTTMLTANYLLGQYTEMNENTRKAAAWVGAGLCWISAMAGLHPITKRVNEYLNNTIKNVYHKLTDNKNTPTAL